MNQSEKANITIPMIGGATASGKSRLAMWLAETVFNHKNVSLELVTADAMQVYIGMDIGTAKPSVADQKLVPHHLIDLVTPEVSFNVADYVEHAETAIAKTLARGNLPIIVGGTGFYLDALAKGLPTVPPADADVQAPYWQRYEQEGSIDNLVTELAAQSPADAQRTQRNPRRVIRALEILERTGNSPSSFPLTTPKYKYGMIGLVPPVEMLTPRIEARAQSMLNQGLILEVVKLLKKYPHQPTALQAIGYKEVAEVLALLDIDSEIDVAKIDIQKLDGVFSPKSQEEIAAKIVLGTVQYAKRQRTWFRRIATKKPPQYVFTMLIEQVVDKDFLAGETAKEILQLFYKYYQLSS